MLEFWNGLSSFSQVYFVIACIATAVLVIQLILLIIGVAGGALGDTDGTDIDSDVDSDSSFMAGIITVKGIVAFLSIGGWVGMFTDMAGLPIPLSLLISFVCGAASLFGVGFAFKAMAKLQTDGSLDIKNAVGKSAEVYLTIPSQGNGLGKVTVVVQERETEFDARTNSDEPIHTGSIVKVTGVLGNSLVVEAESAPN